MAQALSRREGQAQGPPSNGRRTNRKTISLHWEKIKSICCLIQERKRGGISGERVRECDKVPENNLPPAFSDRGLGRGFAQKKWGRRRASERGEGDSRAMTRKEWGRMLVDSRGPKRKRSPDARESDISEEKRGKKSSTC